MSYPRFLKYQEDDGRYRFHVSALDGSILFISKSYRTSSQRDRGILIIQEEYSDRTRYQPDIADYGYSIFHFMTIRKGIVGTSCLYESMAERDQGIQRFMNSVAIAGVEEE